MGEGGDIGLDEKQDLVFGGRAQRRRARRQGRQAAEGLRRRGAAEEPHQRGGLPQHGGLGPLDHLPGQRRRAAVPAAISPVEKALRGTNEDEFL